MINYFIFDADGNILRTGSASSDAVARLQVRDGEEIGFGPADETQHKVQKDGDEILLVPRTEPLPTSAKLAAILAINRIEQRSLRALRELLLDPDDAAARQRIADADAEIAQHRTVLISTDQTP
jgi:hypothetical protein